MVPYVLQPKVLQRHAKLLFSNVVLLPKLTKVAIDLVELLDVNFPNLDYLHEINHKELEEFRISSF